MTKALMFPFHWGYVPSVIHEDGFRDGAIKLFTLQFTASILIWATYDLIGKDLVGIVEIKRRMSSSADGLRVKLGWKKGSGRSRSIKYIARIAEYLICSWQLIPPLALLVLRNNGTKRHPAIEVAMLSGSVLFVTVWWSLISMGFLGALTGVWNTIKTAAPIITGIS